MALEVGGRYLTCDLVDRRFDFAASRLIAGT